MITLEICQRLKDKLQEISFSLIVFYKAKTVFVLKKEERVNYEQNKKSYTTSNMQSLTQTKQNIIGSNEPEIFFSKDELEIF